MFVYIFVENVMWNCFRIARILIIVVLVHSRVGEYMFLKFIMIKFTY